MIGKFALLLLLVAAATVHSEDPFVSLAQGALRGRILKSVKGKPFYSFQGIPYAKPPVGELRFKDPQPPEPWTGVRDAREDGNVCPQGDYVTGKILGDEDCLFVNVYTPELPDGQKKLKKDVMVSIHGGAFFVGSGDSKMTGPDLLMDADIVLVTLNYRLGVLGFLSTGDAASPGNYGLKDQVQALKWVQQNIAAFGGNPDSVTIFGVSAGGASVHYQILSPLSKGLFHRAIAQSGTALCPWAYTNEARIRAFKLGDLVGCGTQDSEELVKCLSNMDVAIFTQAQHGLNERGLVFIFTFVPTVEREVRPGEQVFLPEHPEVMIRGGRFHKVPWITGVTADEGLTPAAMLFANPAVLQDIQDNFDEVLPIYYQYERNTERSSEVTRRIKDFYLGGKSVGNATWDQFVKMESDHHFFYAADKTVKLHLGSGSPPIHFYQFSYRGSFDNSELFGMNYEKGVPHGSDIMYLFKTTFFKHEIKAGDPEMVMVDRLIKLWTNFAKTGNPTPEATDLLPVTWKEMTLKDLHYLDIGKELELKKNLHQNRTAFWDSMSERFKGYSYTSRDEL